MAEKPELEALIKRREELDAEISEWLTRGGSLQDERKQVQDAIDAAYATSADEDVGSMVASGALPLGKEITNGLLAKVIDWAIELSDFEEAKPRLRGLYPKLAKTHAWSQVRIAVCKKYVVGSRSVGAVVANAVRPNAAQPVESPSSM